MKQLLPTLLAFMSLCTLMEVVFGDPLPVSSLWEGKPIQYLSVTTAQLCGLLVGIIMLKRNSETKWQKATIAVSIALIMSYAIGIVIWTLGYLSGILIHNPVNPFFNASTHPLGPVILLLPEFIGTGIGTIIIRRLLSIRWKTAFASMAAAMLTSFLVGMLIVNIYLT